MHEFENRVLPENTEEMQETRFAESAEQTAEQMNESILTAEYPVSPQAAADSTQKNILAALAYCPVLFFLPLLQPKHDECAANSMNQGCLLLVLFLALKVFDVVLDWILPYSMSNLIILVAQTVLFVLTAMGMVRAYNNRIYQLPLIGHVDVISKLKGGK